MQALQIPLLQQREVLWSLSILVISWSEMNTHVEKRKENVLWNRNTDFTNEGHNYWEHVLNSEFMLFHLMQEL